MEQTRRRDKNFNDSLWESQHDCDCPGHCPQFAALQPDYPLGGFPETGKRISRGRDAGLGSPVPCMTPSASPNVNSLRSFVKHDHVQPSTPIAPCRITDDTAS